ncbi:MAG: calcium-binding protein [Pseudomonadota bacterium]
MDSFEGGTLLLQNYGLVESFDDNAVELAGTASNLASFASIENAGTIQTAGTNSLSAAIRIANVERAEIVNTGVISTGGNTAIFIVTSQSDAVSNIDIVNTGLINGSISSAIETIFFNGGDVNGNVLLSSPDDEVTNTGRILGDLNTFIGDDQVFNTGLITGDVELDFSFGSDDDVFDGFGGQVLGTIFGYGGDDIIRSGYGDDRIDGGSGADLINGGMGEDTLLYSASDAGVTLDLRGGVGYGSGGDATGDIVLNIENVVGSDFDDVIRGDNGANALEGGAGADDLRGFAGADQILGGEGDDTLFGFADNDILTGGLGADVLAGGDGADVFVYDDGDTGRGGDSDRITDFGADDLLDLSGIDAIAGGGDNAFVLLDQGQNFTGAGGEARFVMNASGVTLQYDADGDKIPDGAIVFTNGYMPTEDQIIL